MSSLELEAGKLELIREIVNINSSTALESLRKYMKEVLNKNSHSIPTAADSKLLTKRMLASMPVVGRTIVILMKSMMIYMHHAFLEKKKTLAPLTNETIFA